MTNTDYALPSDEVIRRLEQLVDAGTARQLDELQALVRIPSVSWPAFDQANVATSATAVADLLTQTNLFDDVQVTTAVIPGTETDGNPTVLAVRHPRNGAPTILLYAHHDVQPPGSDEDWKTAPFEPQLIDGRLYGRGTADDKAGIMAHVGALRTIDEAIGEDLDLGIVVLIEGEEEYGSRSFPAFLTDHKDSLRSDVIIVADSGNWDENTPGLTVSLRGNVTMTLTVRTLEHASHSGLLGGPVPDAFLAMVRLVNSFWDAAGGVAVEGLHRHIADTPEYDEERLRDEAGFLPGVSTIGDGTILSRMWNQPSITVTGIDAPNLANASNTLLPEVSVRVSVRVAPGQAPKDAFAAVERHIAAHTPFGASVKLSNIDLGAPFLADVTSPAARLAEAALSRGYGQTAVQMGVGGSIPFIALLADMFPAAEVLVTGVEDPRSHAHSPNESLHLQTLRNATLSEALIMAGLNASNSR